MNNVITTLPTRELDITDTLRRLADGRIMLRMRGGISTPAALLARAADEIDRLRAALKLKDDALNALKIGGG